MCGGLLTYDDIYSTGKKGKKQIRNIEIDGVLQVPAMDYDLAMRIKAHAYIAVHIEEKWYNIGDSFMLN